MQTEIFDPVIEHTSAGFEDPQQGVRRWLMDIRESGQTPSRGRLTFHFRSLEQMKELHIALGQHVAQAISHDGGRK
jgi:hypothetical protein